MINIADLPVEITCFGAGEDESRTRAYAVGNFVEQLLATSTSHIRVIFTGAYSALALEPPTVLECDTMLEAFASYQFSPQRVSVVREDKALTTAQNLEKTKLCEAFLPNKRVVICCSPEQRIVVKKMFSLWGLSQPEFIVSNAYGFATVLRYWAITAGARSIQDVLRREAWLIALYRKLRRYPPLPSIA